MDSQPMYRFRRISLRTLVFVVLLVASGFGLYCRRDPWVLKKFAVLDSLPGDHSPILVPKTHYLVTPNQDGSLRVVDVCKRRLKSAAV